MNVLQRLREKGAVIVEKAELPAVKQAAYLIEGDFVRPEPLPFRLGRKHQLGEIRLQAVIAWRVRCELPVGAGPEAGIKQLH